MIEQCDSKSHLHQISIPGLPEGYRAVEFKIDPKSCIHIGDDGNKYITAKLQLEKIKPRRVVLEEITKEEYYRIFHDEPFDKIYDMGGSYWKQVKETDIPLINEDANVKMGVRSSKIWREVE